MPDQVVLCAAGRGETIVGPRPDTRRLTTPAARFENEDGSICGVEVQAYPSNMLSHWSTHCEIPLESWQCTVVGCGASFTRKDARDNHINSQHKTKTSAAAAAAELFKKRKL